MLAVEFLQLSLLFLISKTPRCSNQGFDFVLNTNPRQKYKRRLSCTPPPAVFFAFSLFRLYTTVPKHPPAPLGLASDIPLSQGSAFPSSSAPEGCDCSLLSTCLDKLLENSAMNHLILVSFPDPHPSVKN